MGKYVRVIPRDLFNEANLLKCYGQLYLNLETWNGGRVELVALEDGEPFDIRQDQNSGALSIVNVQLIVRGEACALERPLNSRQPWPLWLTTEDDEAIPVFNNDGSFSDEMKAFLSVA